MNKPRTPILMALVFAPVAAVFAAQAIGTLPAYPGARVIAPGAAGSPHVREATTLLASVDGMQKVDAWFKQKISSRCARVLAFNPLKFDDAHADIRYACQDGSITLHADGTGTQIGYVPQHPTGN